MCVVIRLVLLLLLLPQVVLAATYHVSKSGNGSQTCSTTAANAPTRINTALGCPGPGDTLLIHAGTYDEQPDGSFQSGTSSAYVKIAGAPGELVEIRPSSFTNAMLDFINKHHVWWDNVTLNADLGTTPGWTPASGLPLNNGDKNVTKVESNSHHIRITNSVLKNAICMIQDSNASACKGISDQEGQGGNEYIGNEIFNNLGYGIYLSSSGNVFEGNKVHDNYRYGIHAYSDHNGTVSNNIIRNNIVWNNGKNDWYSPCWAGCYHPGVLVSSGEDNLFYNNVVYNNWGAGLQLEGDTTGVYNNTIYGNGRHDGGCMTNGAGDATVRNNICYNNSGGNSVNCNGTCSNNLTGTNPQFVNAGAGNFCLQAGSPAIDAGTSVSSVFTTDLEGRPRPQDGNNSGTAEWDIGAYEFVSGGTCGSGSATGTPTVTITSPACTPTCTVSTASLTTLAGTASAVAPATLPTGAITWACAACTPTSGTATGTTSWSVATIGLAVGTNTLTVTATDSTGLKGTASLTVTRTAPPSQDPIAWWKFDEASGTTATDSAGTHTGTLVGSVTRVAGKIGNGALSFPGTAGAYVSLPDAVLSAFFGDQTICLWVMEPDILLGGDADYQETHLHLSTGTGTGVRLVSSGSGTTPNGQWGVALWNGGTAKRAQTTTQALVNNVWAQLCYTLVGSTSTLTLYTNGVAQPTTDPGGYSVDAGTNVLGARSASTAPMAGQLDDVRIWNRALSASEIAALQPGGATARPPRHRSVVK